MSATPRKRSAVRKKVKEKQPAKRVDEDGDCVVCGPDVECECPDDGAEVDADNR